MSSILPVPETAYAKQDIPLNGKNFTFTFRFNVREDRWRIDIEENDVPIILGLKIVENINLTRPYILSEALGGEIFCIRVQETGRDVGFDNLGIDKEYELVYFTNLELEEL